ncbi:hypothetical protein OSCT_1018 [Oscillochloris trichoides DG-6]|uniref:Uncharacterized protein n=1 Tax=Oscillochloris trichoides DG-6 TaxID=765420 RepID=E1ICG7_9CHLR|nr:hypothetical protein [Oscillochloris trichoides]EFO81095.1 hypothetical protein OSCT_1018 [Oscillochloris trichoides DG-6]
MYNGNGNGGSIMIGGFRIKPIYFYVAGAALLVVVIYMLIRFLNTSFTLHFGAFAGLLLIIANLREVIGAAYVQRGSTALLNLLVGGGLIFAWLAQFLGVLLWIPAILLVGVATPLILGRANVYKAYITTAQGAISNLRRTVIR